VLCGHECAVWAGMCCVGRNILYSRCECTEFTSTLCHNRRQRLTAMSINGHTLLTPPLLTPPLLLLPLLFQAWQ